VQGQAQESDRERFVQKMGGTNMIEAMKQALDALEKNYKLINGEGTRFGLEGAMDGYYSGCFDVDGTNKETENAIASLRQAIAGLESQEPVAYDKTELNCFAQDLYDKKMQEGKHGHYETMFHVVHQAIKRATPPQRTEQNFCPRCGKRTNDIHTCTPPQRTEQEPVQVSPLEFVEMVMEKEHLIGKPIFWAEWPNKEKNNA
jgi:hypothetical protein